MGKPPKPVIQWKIAAFGKLSGLEVHHMLRLREEIFVVEQNCAYHEIDGKDPECYHVIGFTEKGEVIATARIAPIGVIYKEISIGRVTVNKDFREFGIGRELMIRAMNFSRDELKAASIKIAAQEYLEKFYKALGFITISASYLWDGILHVDMRITY